jgi:hypothetical protein
MRSYYNTVWFVRARQIQFLLDYLFVRAHHIRPYYILSELNGTEFDFTILYHSSLSELVIYTFIILDFNYNFNRVHQIRCYHITFYQSSSEQIILYFIRSHQIGLCNIICFQTLSVVGKISAVHEQGSVSTHKAHNVRTKEINI